MNPADSRILSGMFDAIRTSAVLSAAIELGVFPVLTGAALTAEDVADKIQASPRGTRVLLDALTALDPAMLSRRGNSYALTRIARDYLVPGQQSYVGEGAPSAGLMQGLARLGDAVRKGGSVLTEHALSPGNPHWAKSAQECGYAGLAWAQLLARWLQPWVLGRESLRVLDVGCGSGVNGFALASQHPKGHVTLLDQPHVLAAATATQERFRIADERVSFLGGDVLTREFPGPFDVVLISHLFHFLDKATCQGLAKKAVDALALDGRVVIQERLVTGPTAKDALMFSVEMLCWSPTGEAYSTEQYDEWFGLAGLKRVEANPRCPEQHRSYQR